MNISKNLIFLQVMSPGNPLVIHPTNHPTDQYPKGLERSQEKKLVKTTKVMKTITKAKKLRNIAYLPALLLFLYHLFCLSKKTHLDDKNLKQNLPSLFFHSPNQNFSITFIFLKMSNRQKVQKKLLIILRNAEDY